MRLRTWWGLLLILIGAGYAVPYLLLSDVQLWSGAFLFWLGFGICVWLLLIARVARWRTEESRRVGEAARGAGR